MTLEHGPDKRKKTVFPWRLLLGLALVVMLVMSGLVLSRLYESEMPRLILDEEISRLGLNNEIKFSAVDEGRGLQAVEVLLRQGSLEVELLAQSFPRQGWLQAGPASFDEVIAVAPRELALADGQVELVLRAEDYSWRNWLAGNHREKVLPLLIDTRPPVIDIGAATSYLRPGGSGLVHYTLNEEVGRHGVLINGFFHPGFPHSPERPGKFIAYIALPHDAQAINEAQVIAEDLAGNRARAGLILNLRRTNFPSDRIDISDNFLKTKMPEFAAVYPGMSGSYLEQFLFVNREVRALNNRQIMEICRSTHPGRLWDGAFLRMARSSQLGGFGDQRSYFFADRQIDEQVHLGLDLASVRQADIQAANHGIVVFVDYLGIYGNTVIIDHGQGVFSLYAHLSRFTVAVGDPVNRGDILGFSGVSGLAGGDHLHFSMMVNGVFVTPFEWFDRSWVLQQLTPRP